MNLSFMKGYDLAAICVLMGCLVVQLAQPQSVTFFQQLNHIFSFIHAEIWINLTMLGDTLVLLCAMTPLILYRPKYVYGLIASIPLGGFLSAILKKIFNAPRPGDVLSLNDYHALTDVLSGHSFPSGHSITAFAVASVVIFHMRTEKPGVNKFVKQVIVLTLASLIACSRVALGVHWPIDVVAGASVGWIAGLSGCYLLKKFPKFWGQHRLKWIVLLLLIVVEIFLIFRTSGNSEGEVTVYFSLLSVLFTITIIGFDLLKKKDTRVLFLKFD